MWKFRAGLLCFAWLLGSAGVARGDAFVLVDETGALRTAAGNVDLATRPVSRSRTARSTPTPGR